MTATPEQVASIGHASRDLLRFAWAREPRSELLVTSSLIGVGRTFATDPQASAALMREAIAADHLKEHGYRELRWIAQEIIPIAKGDPSLAVEIYQAAYGFAETSDESTPMGSSQILSLRSNRRQDYLGAWHQLSEAITPILRDDLAAGVRAVARSIRGYVQRERSGQHRAHEPSIDRFAVAGQTASFEADWSSYWFRGGYQPNQDAPVLLKKFEHYLDHLATEGGADAKFGRVLTTLVNEPHVVAAMWASLLIAGTKHPALYAHFLLPLASASTLMVSSDTRFQLGNFLSVAFEFFSEADRETIERTILALPDNPAGNRAKVVLAGCLPRTRIFSTEMGAYVDTLEQADKLRPNVPPMRITSSMRAFDTDAYLESEGVALADPASESLRRLMRSVEAHAGPGGGADLSLASVKQQLGDLKKLYAALTNKCSGTLADTLVDHAGGLLGEAAMKLTRAEPDVLASSAVKGPLRKILLFSSTSKNPRYNAKHANDFHTNVSWGGPSARTAAAHGLLDFTRASKTRDPQVMTAIRKLARDRMPEVRLQIAQNLQTLFIVDPQWAWSELEHVLAKDRARGVVNGAIDALARIAQLDVPRAIRAAKGLIRRYRGKNAPGMASCQSDAATLIFDLHMFDTSPEADRFAVGLISTLPNGADHIRHLVARYSSNLLRGTVDDPPAPDNGPRRKTLAFYQAVTERAFAEIEDRASRLDFRSFDSWPAAEQTAVREMFGILDEVSLRLQFATGNHHGPPPEVSPELARLYWEARPIVSRLAKAIVVPVAHHLIQMLETFIPTDPAGVFELIAQAVRSAQQSGYSDEHMAADLIVRIVQRYLADYRAVFSDPARLNELMDCLDVFVRAGWPAAQALTFKLGEIWR